MLVPIRMARQALLQPHDWCSLMVTTSACGNHTVDPKKLKRTRQLTISAHGVIDFLPSQPFHIPTSSFFAKIMQAPKGMVVAYAIEDPTFVMTASSTFQYQRPLQTSKTLECSSLRN